VDLLVLAVQVLVALKALKVPVAQQVVLKVKVVQVVRLGLPVLAVQVLVALKALKVPVAQQVVLKVQVVLLVLVVQALCWALKANSHNGSKLHLITHRHQSVQQHL